MKRNRLKEITPTLSKTDDKYLITGLEPDTVVRVSVELEPFVLAIDWHPYKLSRIGSYEYEDCIVHYHLTSDLRNPPDSITVKVGQ